MRGLRVTETGGDGIQIGSCTKGVCAGAGRNSSFNVLVEDCVLDHNYRQGMSVESATNLVVRNTTFSYTGVPFGTPPMACKTPSITSLHPPLQNGAKIYI